MLTANGNDTGASHRRSMRRVSAWRINVLPQMRRDFNPTELNELRDSISEKGVLNAPIIALFTRAELVQYLGIINRLWHSSIEATNLKSSRVRGHQRWYVLLAGERRLRSYRSLVKTHEKDRFLQTVVHEHLHPFDALDIQFSENCHRRVLPHEEAYAYGEYWALLQSQQERALTLTGFAKRVGRSSSAVRAALRFVSLPAVIRHAVAGEWGVRVPQAKLFRKENLRLAYGIAVELARLAEKGQSESDLIRLMVEVIISGTKVEKFHERVNLLLSESRGQGLLDLMSEAAEIEEQGRYRRRTVEAKISRILCSEEAYFARVLTLCKARLLAADEAPFATGSVRERLTRVAALCEEVFPYLHKRPSSLALRRFAQIRRVANSRPNVNAIGTLFLPLPVT